MLNYIYDFLSILFDKLKDREKISAIVLFGSVARNTQRKDSDVDLFIDCEKQYEKEVRTIVQESLNEFELKAQEGWHLKGIENPIVPIIGALADERWSELRKEIESTGVSLYRSLQEPRFVGRRMALLTYDLSKCKQKQKMYILRRLYGYMNKKGKKTYAKEGLITSLKGEKLHNVVLVGRESSKAILKEIKNAKVPYTVREVWQT